jgi:hypothetical protein
MMAPSYLTLKAQNQPSSNRATRILYKVNIMGVLPKEPLWRTPLQTPELGKRNHGRPPQCREV